MAAGKCDALEKRKAAAQDSPVLTRDCHRGVTRRGQAADLLWIILQAASIATLAFSFFFLFNRLADYGTRSFLPSPERAGPTVLC